MATPDGWEGVRAAGRRWPSVAGAVALGFVVGLLARDGGPPADSLAIDTVEAPVAPPGAVAPAAPPGDVPPVVAPGEVAPVPPGVEGMAGAVAPIPPPARLAEAAPAGRWRRTADSPLSSRTGFASAWTGRELLVWGGHGFDGLGSAGYLADGAAYDPRHDRWRRLPPAPLAGRRPAAAGWTGAELVVWGGRGDGNRALADGAAYDPQRDRWRRLAAAPLTPRQDAAAAWTGSELVVWGGFDPQTGRQLGDGARYDPGADRWQPMAPRAVTFTGPESPTAAVAGASVLVAQAGAGPTYLARYQPAADRWLTVQPPPAPADLQLSLVGTGRVVSAVGASARDADAVALLRYDPLADRWTRGPGPPGPWRAGAPLTWTGAALVRWDGSDPAGGVILGPGRDRWRLLAPAPLRPRSGHAHAWAGDRLVVWGGVAQGRTTSDGAVWTLR